MNPRVSVLAKHFDRDRMVRRLQEMIQIPATSGQEGPMAEYLAGALRSVGCDAVYVDSHWNILAEKGGNSRGSSLLFLTHIDSGPAGNMEDPYSGKVLDGEQFGKKGPVVYGRGACAPKAAIAAILEALTVSEGLGILDRANVRVAAVTKDLWAQHEGVRELDRDHPLTAQFVVGGETTDNQIMLGARGIARFEVCFHGGSAHLGRPGEAANPLYAIAELLSALEHFQLPTHPALGSATLAPYEVSSEAAAPRTPHLARMLLDRRLLPGEVSESIREDLQDLVDKITGPRKRVSGEVILRGGMLPFQVPEESSVIQLLQQAAKAVLGHTLSTSYASYSSNAAYLIEEKGIAGLAFGPGRIADVNDTEHVEISQVFEAALVLAGLCALVSN
jgi:acetylornithine deacetylase/succinyl-diaminopimelate desuccinylase-like protein